MRKKEEEERGESGQLRLFRGNADYNGVKGSGFRAAVGNVDGKR